MLEMLPYSYGNSTRLKHLRLRDCPNLTISNRTLEDITTLVYLDLYSCSNVKELTPQITNQRFLKYLDLSATSLKELPTSFGELCSLECLKVGGDLLQGLSPSFSYLGSLNDLSLLECPKFKCMPESFGMLS